MKNLLIILMLFSASAQAVNLQDYFPDNRVNYYANAQGGLTARFSFTKNNPDMRKKFPFKKKGTVGSWAKAYNVGGAYQHVVTQPLFFGTNRSVIELGGVKEGGQTTYKSGGYTGLYWSAPGGIDYNFKTKVMDVYVNGNHGDLRAYSRTRLVELLPSFTLEAGNKQTYQNVAHMVMYHGTATAAKKVVRCWNAPVLSAGYVPYIPMKGYNSIAIELWLAPGVGIIKHRIAFAESPDGRHGFSRCSGNMFTGGDSWTDYLVN
ncbi:MAG: hypothetical protein WC901_00800 [Candidatus Margulisiibacteriota bacterium]